MNAPVPEVSPLLARSAAADSAAGWRQARSVILAAIAASLLLLAGLWAYQRWLEQTYGQVWAASQIEPVGADRVGDQGLPLLVRPRPDARQWALNLPIANSVDSRELSLLTLDVADPALLADAVLGWRLAADPRMRYIPLARIARSPGRYAVGMLRFWRGDLVKLGIVFPRQSAANTLEIRSISLQPASLWPQLLDPWRQAAGWTQGSINFNRDMQTVRGWSPLALAWVWLLLALPVYRMLARRADGALRGGWAVLFLVVWLVLDLRWQGQLWARHGEALELFAGRSWSERKERDLDGALFTEISRIHQQLPRQPQRIHLVTAQPWNRYPVHHAHYHLLPHFVRITDGPDLERMRPGDYLYRLGEMPEWDWRQASRSLSWRGQSLKAREVPLPDNPAALFLLLAEDPVAEMPPE